MQLHKSDKARLELASRARVLNVRERGALFLADGRKTLDEMQGLLQDDGSMLRKLISDGYLISGVLRAAEKKETTGKRPGQLVSVPAFTASAPIAPAAADVASPQGDNFEGKRSLATTRMFLFDICERMFVRKMPDLAKQYRDQLREARDRESMMSIARDILRSVEEIAGPERADGLSARISMLLPPEA